MTLIQIIERAKQISVWTHAYTNEKNYPNNQGLTLLQLSQDICDVITILIDQELPGPAFVLARPMRDSFVRGLWLLKHASNDEVERVLEKNKFPKLNKLLKAIGNDEETGGAWINKFCELNREYFDDLTHGGMTHVLRRTTDHSIEPIYSEEEQTRLMQNQIGIQLHIAYTLLDLANNRTKIEELYEIARDISQ